MNDKELYKSIVKQAQTKEAFTQNLIEELNNYGFYKITYPKEKPCLNFNGIEISYTKLKKEINKYKAKDFFGKNDLIGTIYNFYNHYAKQ